MKSRETQMKVKFQITNKKGNKAQRDKGTKEDKSQKLCAYKLVIWSLEFVWDLVLGIY